MIKGLMPQFINFRGRAVRQGIITKMFEEAAKFDLGAPDEKVPAFEKAHNDHYRNTVIPHQLLHSPTPSLPHSATQLHFCASMQQTMATTHKNPEMSSKG